MSYYQCGLSAFNRFWKSVAWRFLRCFIFRRNILQRINTRNSSVWFYVTCPKSCNWKRCWKRSNLLPFHYWFSISLRWILFSSAFCVCVKFCFFKKYLNEQWKERSRNFPQFPLRIEQKLLFCSTKLILKPKILFLMIFTEFCLDESNSLRERTIVISSRRW